MKCVQYTKKYGYDKPQQIVRVSDKEARALVNSGEGNYIAKRHWKVQK